MNYRDFFQTLTTYAPYPYQERMGTGPWPDLLDVPTGLGKTAAVAVAWLWKRLRDDPDTARRLVYCLPMRVLVEQIHENLLAWIERAAPLFRDAGRLPPQAFVLMGGEVEDDWQLHPERDMVLVGTQDMLLSRALNRGYAMSRAMWPWHFALINNDCFWVLDETQLMGAGLATTVQLQGFRNHMGVFGPARTLWMSATLDNEAMNTVDAPALDLRLDLKQDFLSRNDDPAKRQVLRRVRAEKRLVRLDLDPDDKRYTARLAQTILEHHHGLPPSSVSLVVLNQVERAQDVFSRVRKLLPAKAGVPVLLAHGRFRPAERQEITRSLLHEIPVTGGIVIATQTVEAGVDLDAACLYTELSPWPSLVQRFGRCNRRGECEDATVFWVDLLSGDDKTQKKLAPPYDIDELAFARSRLEELDRVSPDAVTAVNAPSKKIFHVIRRKDLVELFDTTPDLTGADVDVSRFIREGDDNDVRVFWRAWEGAGNGDPPPPDFPAPERDELCAVPVGKARSFLKKQRGWRWDFVDREWIAVRGDAGIFPGIVILLPEEAGGYAPELGWTGKAKKGAALALSLTASHGQDADAADTATFSKHFVPLRRHCEDTSRHAAALEEMLAHLAGIPWAEVRRAARWHDVGKAHPAFQEMLLAHLDELAQQARQAELWAKSDCDYFRNPGCGTNQRRFFRHELASAIAMLENGASDLAAYLVASHHGKVRLSIRSQAGETADEGVARYARGVWEGDELPACELGGEVMPATRLRLGYMEMGLHPDTGRSWLERALALRDTFGPFRLAFLESLVRIADWRATIEEENDVH